MLTQCHIFTTPLSLPFVSRQRGFPPLHAYANLSPPSHIHAPWSCQAFSLQLWRSFCHSTDQFPGCYKQSDLNIPVIEGWGSPRVSLLLLHLLLSPHQGVVLMVKHNLLRLSWLLFIFFPFCSSDLIISTKISSSSLIIFFWLVNLLFKICSEF